MATPTQGKGLSPGDKVKKRHPLESIVNKFKEPIPKEFIKEREGWKDSYGNTYMLQYVEWTYVADVLDRNCVSWGYSVKSLEAFELQQWNKKSNQMETVTEFAVIITLTLATVSRDGIGTGNSIKAAEHDGLKRAATHFGIARELYELGPVKVSDGGGQQQQRQSSGPPAQRSDAPASRGPGGPPSGAKSVSPKNRNAECSMKQRKAIEYSALKLGWDDLAAYVAEWGFDWETLTMSQASTVIKESYENEGNE